MKLRRGVTVLAGLVLIALVLGGIRRLYLVSNAEPRAFGSVEETSLGAPVRIVRDPAGVPHVRAAKEREAMLGLGFAHAQDRLWQMEMLRRSARGTLSELFGETTLAQDRLARVLGFSRAASTEAEGLSTELRETLEAYSAGVNLFLARIANGEERQPLELRRLRVELMEWKPEDSLAIVRLRAWLLIRSLRSSVLLDQLVREIGGIASQDFFPVRPIETGPELIGSLLRLGETADALARGVGLLGPVGSLGFVVGPRRSMSAHALLANDPHVELRLPPVFYVAHLSAPGWDLSGGTWPGVPLFWTGTNREIAWGQVITHASVSELFEETLHPDDPRRYAQGTRWKDVTRESESIGVRGGPDEPIEILETRNGPLLGSVYPEDRYVRALALRWTGQSKRSGAESMLRVHRARSWDDFRHALRRLPGPPASFLYASRKGTVGIQVAGHLPLRAIETGLLPVPGRSRYYRWRGFIPFKALPHQHGSKIPWLVASTHPPGFELSHRVTWLWSPGGAAERLQSLLHGRRTLDIGDVLRIQRDRHSARGTELVRKLLGDVQPRGSTAVRLREALLAWDGSTDTGSRGATLYHFFRRTLARLLLEAHAGRQIAEQLGAAAEPLPGVVLARFVDRAAPLDEELIERALAQAWGRLESAVSSNPAKWEWGRTHRLVLPHDFARLGRGPLAWLGRYLSRGPFPVAGDADSVWTMHHHSLPADETGVGPGFRYTIDLGDPDHAFFGLAGGQSGHPSSVHYDDALEEWLRGHPRPLWMHRGDIEHHASGVWELLPPSG